MKSAEPNQPASFSAILSMRTIVRFYSRLSMYDFLLLISRAKVFLLLTNCYVYAIMYYVMVYNRIALLRTEFGMSRQDLAEKIDVNYQTVGFIERGDYSPSLELAFKIAEVFGVEITTVFSDKPFAPLFTKKES